MLDVLTPKGQAAEERAREVVLRMQKPGQTFAWFPKNNYYPVDGFVIQGNDVTALFECKVRDVAYDNGALVFSNKRYDSLILSEAKILSGSKMGKEMCLDFYLIAYLQKSGHCLIYKLYDRSKDAIIAYQAKETYTQATVNGGQALRMNAFLSVRDAVVRKV